VIHILEGDTRHKLQCLASGSVHCVVTSPPYYGLRDYGVDGQIGLERTPEQYVCEIVHVMRGVRRVLRDDGTVWLNIGDSYAPNWSSQRERGGRGLRADDSRQRWTRLPGIAPKQLLMIPARVALALQADGWFLRSDIIWSKTSCMPESATDRPSNTHEHVFLLTKAARYFYDAAAVAEQSCADDDRRQTRRAIGLAEQAGLTPAHIEALRACGVEDAGKAQVTPGGRKNTAGETRLAAEAKAALGGYTREFLIGGTRNIRNVWTIATQPYSGAHFAVMPPELAERCIKAGTPSMASAPPAARPGSASPSAARATTPGWARSRRRGPTARPTATARPATATASCPACAPGRSLPPTGSAAAAARAPGSSRATVLDPFAGAFTTALAADRLGRHAIGIELNARYCKLARERIEDDAGLFAQITQEAAPALPEQDDLFGIAP
jgi:DNA modification methylase